MSSLPPRRSTMAHIQHPLLKYDPDILNGGIQLIKLEYFETRARAPVPRNQEVPKEAFGTLTGRSILVATSHAWFYQCHPDPHGTKLMVLRKEFFPSLRERFPKTDILIFDDWHSCPQWPRTTKEEEKRFKKCMDHMNSIYRYCDVVLFIEVPLPKLDDTILTCDLIPSKHKWLHFIDTIQYLEGENPTSIQKNDIVVAVGNVSNSLAIDILQQRKKKTTISYLRRPYGRPNRTPAEERGWLYAERITVAIRMAAARPEFFDDVVMSNSLDLTIQIFGWSHKLRTSAQSENKHAELISKQLELFQAALGAMKFTFPKDRELVNEIMTDLVTEFNENWDEEAKRQNDMAKRARELLLRWGEFSEEYVERAGFLKKDKESWSETYQTLMRMVVLVVIPAFSIYLFCFDMVENPTDNTSLLGSIFVACGICMAPTLIVSQLRMEFVNVSPGVHTIRSITIAFLQLFFFSLMLRFTIGVSPIPFEVLWLTILTLKIGNTIIFRPKLISTTHPRTKEKIRVSMELYPIIGGIFYNSDVVVQACVVPIFFILRASYEYGADTMTSKTFGSDGMPVICLFGVAVHEVCLTLMMTSISHPLIFTILLMCDVLENTFCLWSLSRSLNQIKSNKVVPCIETNTSSHQRTTSTTRSSSVYNLVRDFDSSISEQERKGVSLFITATLLQRELIETFVPIQAMGIISMLYNLDVKSNALVSRWTSYNEYHRTIMYMGIDFGVEIVVFVLTIVTLRSIFPDVSAWRVLSGLLKMHFYPMVMCMYAGWYFALLLQSTHLGMDTTFRFSWLECGGKENSTWLGGFDWEC